MDLQTARQLNQLTCDFYARVHASFSATRQAPWPGWTRVCNTLRKIEPCGSNHKTYVLDLACGNLRFERYLLHDLPDLHAWAVDNCSDLAQISPLPNVTFEHLDIIESLLDGHDLSSKLTAPLCDLSVCFGFLHHVALPEHRHAVLRALVDHTHSGGLVAISLWQFQKSPRILAKARPLTDKGDYLLGWQNDPDVWRYCHSFSESEVDALASSIGEVACEIDRFSADGKTGNLNRYLVLQVK